MFYFQIFSVSNILCNIKNRVFGSFFNLMSKLLTNALNFISILSSFITVFISSIDLFPLSILTSFASLFVVSFIDSILPLWPSILLTFFSFSVYIFTFSLSNVSSSSSSFQNFFFHYCFSNFLNFLFYSSSAFVLSRISDSIYFMLSLSVISCFFIS